MSKYDVSRFKNVTVALNTPFDKNGEIDLSATKKLTRYYINKGIKGLYVCGSTGEGFLLDNEERKRIVEAVTEEAQNELAVIVHVGCASTKHSAMLALLLSLLFHVFIIDRAKKVYMNIGPKLQKPLTFHFLFITFLNSLVLIFL